MKNPPSGGHRTNRTALTGKVDLGLSEIVEGGASTVSGCTLDSSSSKRSEVALGGNSQSVSPDAFIDLDVGQSSCSSHLSPYSKTMEVFQDAEVQLQSSLARASDNGRKSSLDPSRSPVVEGANPLIGSNKHKRYLSENDRIVGGSAHDTASREEAIGTCLKKSARSPKQSSLGIRWLMLLAVAAAGVSAFSYSDQIHRINLTSQIGFLFPFLSPSDEMQVFSFRSLGLSSDLNSSVPVKRFITNEFDSTPLSVSDLDAVAYKMKRDDGDGEIAGAEGDQSSTSGEKERGQQGQRGAQSDVADSSRDVRGSRGSNVQSFKGERIQAGGNQAGSNQAGGNQAGSNQVGSNQAGSNQNLEAARRESAARLGVNAGNRSQVEINTSGPLEPRLPERESPRVAEEFRDPFARESVSPSPDFPKVNEVRPIMEEPFSQEKILKVQSDISVRSKPSVFGEELASLRAGDSVLAVSQVGEWVRVRSKKGLSGFVLEKALARE